MLNADRRDGVADAARIAKVLRTLECAPCAPARGQLAGRPSAMMAPIECTRNARGYADECHTEPVQHWLGQEPRQLRGADAAELPRALGCRVPGPYQHGL